MKRSLLRGLLAAIGLMVVVLIVPIHAPMQSLPTVAVEQEEGTLYDSYIQVLSSQTTPIVLYQFPSNAQPAVTTAAEASHLQLSIRQVVAQLSGYTTERDEVLLSGYLEKRDKYICYERIAHFYSLRKLVI